MAITTKHRLSVAEMYGASGIPELIPANGPRQPSAAGQYNPGHSQVALNGHGVVANPQRLGQRAPKLGQIGRSKKGKRSQMSACFETWHAYISKMISALQPSLPDQ